MFKCSNCDATISETAIGTKNRNHCPHCLWSNHLDEDIPGDRKSSCKANMKPIGLRFKNIKQNPYTGKTSGELTIVHLCSKCGKISSNRIAGDDDPQAIINLLDEPTTPDIKLLTPEDKHEVMITLYGHNYQKHLLLDSIHKHEV